MKNEDVKCNTHVYYTTQKRKVKNTGIKKTQRKTQNKEYCLATCELKKKTNDHIEILISVFGLTIS